MTILPILLGLAAPTQADAQAAYDKYLAQFANSPGIRGSANSSMMGEKKTTVFRVLPGGNWLDHEPTRIKFCDGKQVFQYSPDANQYIVSPATSGIYGLLFGPRFAEPGFTAPKAERVEEKTVNGWKTETILLAARDNSGPISISIARGRPVNITFYGRQGQWSVEIHELHWTQAVRPETVTWSPPTGAQKVEFLKDP